MTNTKYTVRDYEKQKITEYERHGECNQCGDCCAVRISSHVTEGNGTVAVTNGKDRYEYNVQQPYPLTELCKAFQDNVCVIHEGKPSLCINWPWAPDCLTYFSRCSYTFVEIRSQDMSDDQ